MTKESKDAEVGAATEIDLQEIIAAQFLAGEGVVTIGQNTPDEVILLTIKQAVAFGKPFKVVPAIGVIAHDDLG